MEEKDPKSLTINDILDQLVKPSVIQGPKDQGVSSSPQVPVSKIEEKSSAKLNLPSISGVSGGLSLPSLGDKTKEAELQKKEVIDSKPASLERSESTTSAEVKLSIRTMADDLNRLRRGQMPTGVEARKVLTQQVSGKVKIVEELAQKAEEAASELEPLPPPIPSRPPTFSRNEIKTKKPLPSVPIPSLPVSGSDKQTKERRSWFGFPLFSGKKEKPEPNPQFSQAIKPKTAPSLPIRDEMEKTITTPVPRKIEDLPAYLGAPMPSKKIISPEEDKVEYGLIARVVGSGMTTGILSTVILAAILYLVLSYFVFNTEELPTPTPIATQTDISPTPEINELDAIFRTISAVNFTLSEEPDQAAISFRNFIDQEPIDTKQFKKVNFITDQANQNDINVDYIFEKLGVKYPTELKSVIKPNRLLFLYGQQEKFPVVSNETDNETPARGMVFIVEVTNEESTRAVLKKWELTMPQDFRVIFDIDPTKEASKDFLENKRQGVSIKYKNFPLPDKSVDYAIVSSLTGRKYLVITSSRESMFSPVDKLRGL